MTRNFKITLGNLFKRTLTRISPKLNTRVIYFFKFGKSINLQEPRTLDEKIQYLKFNDYYKNPLITMCADKYRVRDYIKSRGCEEILNTLYGAWDSPDEIVWSELPNKFVLKWNFGCGHNIIVRDKKKLDIEKTKQLLKKWYRTRNTFYLTYSEMQYKDIEPKLLCEKLIDTEDGNLPTDYKVYCFGGIGDCVLVCSGRDSEGKGAEYYFVDQDWNLKRYNKAGMQAPNGFTLPKPENYHLLFEYAKKIPRPFPFVRADFYLEKGKITFGELTFTPCGGFDVNRLPEIQILFGDKIKINKE